MADLEFVTRQNCPLCDTAWEILAPLLGQHGLSVAVLDVDDDPTVASLSDRVPVLRDPSGRVLLEGDWTPRRAGRIIRRHRRAMQRRARGQRGSRRN